MKGIKKINENVVAPYRSLTITGNGLPDNENWQVGTLKCDPSVSGLKYKSAANTYDLFDATYILQPNTVTSELIKDLDVQTIDLANGCVTNEKIAERTITRFKIKMKTLTSEEIENGSITEDVMANNSISSRTIQDKALIERHFSNACINNNALQKNCVGSLNIMNGAIIEDKINTGAVTNPKLGDGAVTWDKMAPYTVIGGETVTVNGKVVQGRIAQGTITNYNLADYTITPTKIMTGAIDNRCLADGAVDNNKIKPKTILNSCIADKTIGSGQIGDQALKTINYADKSVTKTKLSDDVFDVVNNAVVYDADGNVKMLKNPTGCAVSIGSADANGKSMANGSLVVYGDLRADRVYNMAYADIAEGYVPGEELEAGDIVELREDGKIYKTYSNGLPAIIVGVVSDEYAACYGASKEELEDGSKVAVALIGRVHVKVKGPIRIGEPIKINNIPGVGLPWSNNNIVVGKALETVEEDGMHKVLCLIKPS